MNQDKYAHTRPNCGVTIAPFIYEDGAIKALFYLRPEDCEVFPGKLALPNIFYDITEFSSAEDAAHNALVKKAGVDFEHIEQIFTFTGNHIDPRRPTVNIAFMSVLRKAEIINVGGEGLMIWKNVEEVLSKKDSSLAFNHMEVLRTAYERIKAKAEYTPLALKFLDKEFTIKQFRELTELLIGESLNNSRFRDRIEKSGLLISTGEKRQESFGAPAALFIENPNYVGNFFPRSMTSVK